MEVYPIIYTRTYYMDYSPSFYICPSIFDEKMIEKYRDYILDSLTYANMIKEERRVVVSENEYTILGYTCEMENLLIDKSNTDLLSYIKDNKGRSVIAFVGIAFKTAELPYKYIPKNIDLIISKVFLKFVVDKKRWFDREKNHYTEEAFDIEVEEYVKNNIVEDKTEFNNKIIFASNDSTDKEIFFRTIAVVNTQKECSFCSDYYGIESVANSKFQIITSRYFEKIKMNCNNNLKKNKIKKIYGTFKYEKKTKKVISCIIGIMIFIIIAKILLRIGE